MFIFIDFLFYSSVSFGLFLCGVCVWCGLVEHTSFFFLNKITTQNIETNQPNIKYSSYPCKNTSIKEPHPCPCSAGAPDARLARIKRRSDEPANIEAVGCAARIGERVLSLRGSATRSA